MHESILGLNMLMVKNFVNLFVVVVGFVEITMGTVVRLREFQDSMMFVPMGLIVLSQRIKVFSCFSLKCMSSDYFNFLMISIILRSHCCAISYMQVTNGI